MSGIRALTYARVSTGQQASQGYSLPDQEQRLRRHCEDRGYLLVEHVPDGGESGAFSSRPGLDRLFDLLAGRVADVVVMPNINRLSRGEAWEAQMLAAQIRQAGVRLEWLEHGGGDSPEEEMQEGMMAVLSRYQIREIRRKTMRGKNRKAEEQRYPAGLRLTGYSLITRAEERAGLAPPGSSGKLCIVESEAAVVRLVFARFLECGTLYATVKWLNEAGIRGNRGGAWRPTSLHWLLTQRAYVGELIYNRFELRATGEKKPGAKTKSRTRRERPESEWLRIPCPAIVTLEQWERVQTLLHENQARTVRGPKSAFWALRGVVFCGVCLTRHGEPRRCTGNTSGAAAESPGPGPRATPRYQCPTHLLSVPEPFCGSTLNAKALHAYVREALRRAIQPGVLAAEALRQAAARAAQQQDGAELAAFRSELADLDKRTRNLVELAARGHAVDIVGQQLAALDERRRQLQELLGAADRRTSTETPEALGARCEEIAELLRSRWTEIETDPDLFQRVCFQLVQVSLYPGKQFDIRITPGSHFSL